MTVMAGLIALVAAGAIGGLWYAVTAWRRALESRMAGADADLRRLADTAAWRETAAGEMRQEVSALRQVIGMMEARNDERRARDEAAWAELQRVGSVLAGGQRSGRAGENVLREALSCLPPTMVVTDFQVNGRVVEFGLVLPDGRRLPVDSKWTADRELQALAEAEDPVERERLVRHVEQAVASRAREVAKYLDPTVTSPLALAVVPDAAYAVSRRAHAEAYRHGVIVISYSLALPLLLFLYGIVSRVGGAVDAQACLTDLSTLLAAMEGTLENKVERASTMLSNAAQEFRGHLGKARSTIAAASMPKAGPTATGLEELPFSIVAVDVDAEDDAEPDRPLSVPGYAATGRWTSSKSSPGAASG
jgi:DNA recombination protein RmuC